jgi:predicted metal-dependent phosphotriesterase family hydrolase
LFDREARRVRRIRFAFGRALTVLVPKLRAAGVKQETLRTIVHDNPLRFLAFQPKMG